jgi:FkbH-like protein
MSGQYKEVQTIKCVIWDLDNTLWTGVLSEGDQVSLRPGIASIIEALDRRGILHSIASKNDDAAAMAKLEQLGMHEYFLYPQISWNSKLSSLKAVAEALNIGLDTLAFIDDDAFERDEVAFSLPQVLCIDAKDIDSLLDMPRLKPTFLTSDATHRRFMYMSDRERKRAENEFVGSHEEFLATLHMVFTISRACAEDLQRAEELTVRTNQLNTTGYTYSYEELDQFRQSARHKLFIASLDDTYGTYGKIGLALLECSADTWTIKLLLMSCRVLSRGLGTIMINYLLSLAKDSNVRLHAEFVPNDRNRIMYITYKLGGFKEIEKTAEHTLLEGDLSRIQAFPAYVKVQTPH